jgi:hypothetical protein
MGLSFDPFEIVDAGKDPHIPLYLIDLDAYQTLMTPAPSFVFAPIGGGKTAFRVYLAQACRSNEDNRRIFAVVYQPTETEPVGWDALAQAAAQELLLYFLHHPLALVQMNEDRLAWLRSMLYWSLSSGLEIYLDQMESEASIDPILNAFDPTARMLPNPPDAADIVRFCALMRQRPGDAQVAPPGEERFHQMIQFVFEALKFREIFLLIDGVDAFYETARSDQAAYTLVEWLFQRVDQLAGQRIYTKFFLPVGMRAVLQTRMGELLKSDERIVMMNWTEDSLIGVIQERLLVASGGRFRALNSIYADDPRDVERRIVRSVKPYPRAVILRMEQLIQRHLASHAPAGKLTLADLEAVIGPSMDR